MRKDYQWLSPTEEVIVEMSKYLLCKRLYYDKYLVWIRFTLECFLVWTKFKLLVMIGFMIVTVVMPMERWRIMTGAYCQFPQPQKAYYTILWFWYDLPVTYFGWSLRLGETLPPRTSKDKFNSQSAVTTRLPALQHPLENQVTTLGELCSMGDFLQTHLQEPELFLVHE